MHRRLPIRVRRVAAAGLLAAAALPALASGWALPRLPPDAAHAYPTLSAAGVGTLRWFGFRVYDARLWMSSPQPRADQPFVLGLRYARDFDAEDIARTSIAEIERLGFGTAREHARWLGAMRGILPDVREGRELAGLNLPGRGVRFYFEGKAIGEIPDPEFARAFFAIWLDPRTKAPALRSALLGADEGARRWGG
jgi:Chalcone isomerase-like